MYKNKQIAKDRSQFLFYYTPRDLVFVITQETTSGLTLKYTKSLTENLRS